MENLNRDLWPDDIGVVNDISTPVGILKKQASLLGQKTKNLVEAEIKSLVDNNRFIYHFNLIAPALNYYQYHLFSIGHDVAIYPLRLSFLAIDESYELDSQDELIEKLEFIFSHERTKRIIKSLIAQSQT
jgi:hypothetical protein